MKIQSKIILIIFVLLSLFLTHKSFAASLNLEFPPKSPGINEEFYVDITLDTENKPINTIKGSLVFSKDDLSLVRIEDGKSIVNFWVEKPKLEENTISFAGVIMNGFNGVIYPFNTDRKLPGPVLRFIFVAKKSGQINFSTSPFSLNLNDGKGTEIQAQPIKGSINIDNFINDIKYENKKDESIKLEAYVTHDPNIFNDQYVLIFKATDKEMGVRDVMIKEGNKDWKEIDSPYLLKDQARTSVIYIRATSFGGSSVTNKIEPVSTKLITRTIIVIWGLLGILLFILIRKIVIFFIGKKKKNL